MLQTLERPAHPTSPWSEEAYAAYLDWAAAQCRESFYAYRQLMNPSYRWGWFTRSTAGWLRWFYDEFRAGRRPIMMINTPPQHSKSMTILDFAGWVAGKLPSTQIVYASFSDRLGIRANMRMQRALERPLYVHAFGKRLNDTNVVTIANRFLRNHEVLEFLGGESGIWRNTTVKGSITGEGFDLQIIDDPLKGRAEAHSTLERERVWGWMTDDLLTRQSENAALLYIATRWHLDDPAGRLIERFGDRVKILRYPAIATRDEANRKKGEPLFPELKSISFLNERRATLTEASWLSLYQQTPIVVGGGIFPLDKFTVLPRMPHSLVKRSVRYWDKAGTKDGEGAFTAGVLMHWMKDNTYVVEHVVRGRWGALEREQVIKRFAEMDRANLESRYEVWVEQEPGSGGKESAENTIRNLAGFKCYADKVTGEKEIRVEPYAAQVQAGNVSVVAGHWNYEYLDELSVYPNGKFRDQGDASGGAFNKLTSGSRYSVHSGWLD